MPKKQIEARIGPKAGKASDKKQTSKKATAVASGSRSDEVRAWVDRMNKDKKFQGHAQIRFASEMQTPYNLRRPTGILGLDIELGGGFHAGGVAEIHGEESTGKTLLAYLTAAQVQKNYGEDANILILAIEIRPDKGFARLNDFCIAYSEKEIAEYDELRQRRLSLPPFTSEEVEDLRKQVGNVIVVTSDTSDVGLDVVRDGLEMGAFQLIIIESLGALVTKAVAEGDVGDRHYAGPSADMTQFQNMIYPLFMMDRADNTMLETTIIGINQARANIGHSKYESDTKAAMGAHAWKHGQMISIELEKGALLRPDPHAPPRGRAVRWKTTKGKVGTHDGKKGEYSFYFLPSMNPVFWKDVQETWYGGVGVYNEMAETAKRLKVVDVAGSWINWTEKNLRWQGMERFAQALSEDEDLANALREECYKRAGLLVRYQ